MENLSLVALVAVVGFIIVAVVALGLNRSFRGRVDSGGIEIHSDNSSPDEDEPNKPK